MTKQRECDHVWEAYSEKPGYTPAYGRCVKCGARLEAAWKREIGPVSARYAQVRETDGSRPLVPPAVIERIMLGKPKKKERKK